MALPDNPLTRGEQYLNRIATGEGTIPDVPLTRVEQYLDHIAKNGVGADPEQIASAVTEWLDENVDPVGSAVVVDSSLTIEGAAADAKATGDAIRTSGGGLTDDVKQALLDCFENVAWINGQGQTYYDALYAALYPSADVLSISAVFTQGSAVIYDTDDLNTLKQYLVVTAAMTDSTTRTVTDYTLSGTLTEGTSTITVSYGGKTTTFNVTVSQPSIYTVFDFVHPTGGTNTGIVADDVEIPTNFKIETEFYGEYSSATAAIPVMGVRGISGNAGYKYFALYYTSGNGKVGYWYLNADTVVSLTAPTDAKNTIAFEGTNGTLTITLNGTQYTDSYTDPQVSAITGFRFFGFYSPTISSTGQSRNWVGRTKIYNANGVLLYDFVPCYQTTTGFYGFHETVNDKFYTDSSDSNLYVGVNIQ